MPRLDAERIELWRALCRTTADLQRRIDAELLDETGLPLGWFEVLAALQQGNGSLRANSFCTRRRYVMLASRHTARPSDVSVTVTARRSSGCGVAARST